MLSVSGVPIEIKEMMMARTKHRKHAKAGYVYVLRFSEIGVCKIGCSVNLSARIEGLLRENEDELIELVTAFPVLDMYRREREVQEFFSYRRLRCSGELFDLS